MEAWSPQCHWSSPVAKGVMVELEAPILSEAPGLGELSQVEGYLMTQAGRVQVIKKKKKLYQEMRHMTSEKGKGLEKEETGSKSLKQSTKKPAASIRGSRRRRLRGSNCLSKQVGKQRTRTSNK